MSAKGGDPTVDRRAAEERAERAKAAARKTQARLRSIEAIVAGDLRKRGSPALARAVDQWYAHVLDPAADEKSIIAAARDVLSTLAPGMR